MKISASLRSCLYWFIEAYSKGQLGNDRWDLTNDCFNEKILDWEEYRICIADPFVMKVAITVWSNNVEVDPSGKVLNEEWRASGLSKRFGTTLIPNSLQPILSLLLSDGKWLKMNLIWAKMASGTSSFRLTPRQ